MQTFLPEHDFLNCGRVLDDARLRKQRIECVQILRTIDDPERGYQNHPAVNQWRPWRSALVDYSIAISRVCDSRDFTDDAGLGDLLYDQWMRGPVPMPDWWLDRASRDLIVGSHRSNLIRKDSQHYGQFGWNPYDGMPYYWPSKDPQQSCYVPTKAEAVRLAKNKEASSS